MDVSEIGKMQQTFMGVPIRIVPGATEVTMSPEVLAAVQNWWIQRTGETAEGRELKAILGIGKPKS